MPEHVAVSLDIENTYEDGTCIKTQVEADVVAPGEDDFADDLHDWANDVLFDFTGTGKTDGDAWYDVVIVASGDPRLVGRTFEFGY